MSAADNYRDAGVDLKAQEKALGRVKKLMRSTYSTDVLSELGSFGGLYSLSSTGEAPVLVASADGVGTKLMVARMADDLSTVGRDLVNHCVNDILVQGARPLFFLDYVGAGSLDPVRLVELVKGVVAGCKENECALLGGETAEMPGFYQPGDYELVGFIVGLVDRSDVLDGRDIKPRDLLIALGSTGLHTNGYSLARRILFEQKALAIDSRLIGRKTVGQVLLEPHRSYWPLLKDLRSHPALRGLAHITGGGLTDNLPRILPPGLHASIRVGSWEIPEVFHLLQEWGQIESEEMFRVFNMGIGMVAVVSPEGVGDFLEKLRRLGEKGLPIGTVQKGKSGVVYDVPTAKPSEGA